MEVRPVDGNKLIEWFRPYLHTDGPIPADVVIDDIRSMPTLKAPNEPLTLDELRQMDGEPVWVDDEKTYAILQVWDDDNVIPMEFYDAYKSIGQDLNDIGNLLPACRSCNNYKHALTLDKFRAALERMPDVLARDNVTYRNAVRFGLVTPTPHPIVFYFEGNPPEGEEDT